MALYSSLLIPDALEWHEDPNYSFAVAGALTRAYQILKTAHHTLDGYLAAYAELAPYRDSRMAAQQRMHVDFSFALCYLGEDAIPQALDSLDRALEGGESLGDQPAQIELNYLAGQTSFMATEFANAHDYFLTGLESLQALAHDAAPIDSELAVDFLLRLSTISYQLGLHNYSGRLLEDASLIFTRWGSHSRLNTSTLDWNRIQHYRLAGNLDLALRTAIHTADDVEKLGSPSASGRIQTIVAEIASDIGNSYSLETATDARLHYVNLARPYAERARQLTTSAGDLVGNGLARLALLRLDRLRGIEHSRLPALHILERKAQRLHDPALLGRVWTAMADEFAAGGNIEWARKWYSKAQRHLEEYELIAMARLPLRARLR
ncbi:MAG: hypothetical protein ACRDHP_00815, partial [Ktedonobacterales bacterium]